MKKKILLFLILILSLCTLVACFSACVLDDEDVETAKFFFTVKFNGDGGTLVSGEEEQFVKKYADIEFPVYEKEGYDLIGWDPQITVLKEDVEFTAVWEKQVLCTVTFDGDGGQLKSGETVQQVLKYRSVTPPVFVREGYDFAGWDTDVTRILGDTVITALWQRQSFPEFTVTFNGDGGTLVSGNETQTVDHPECIVAPVYERKHFTFAGWDCDLEKITVNTTVTALWTADEYTVSFNLTSLSYPEEQSLVNGQSQVDAIKIKYGESFGDRLPAFTPVNHVRFSPFYWTYVNGEGIKSFINSDTVLNDGIFMDATGLQIELFAELIDNLDTPKYFTVTFYGNGGTLVSGSISQAVENPSQIQEPVFEREGYTFVGWDIDLWNIRGDTVVGALWKIKTYTVNFTLRCFTENQWATSNVNGYDNVPPLTVTYGQSLGDRLYGFTPDDPDTFRALGWKYTPDQGKEFIVDKDTVFNDQTFGKLTDLTIELKAQLILNVFTVRFDGNGGTLVSGEEVQVIHCGDDAVAPVYVREGYEFVGFDVSFENVLSDLSVKAIWHPLKYVVKFNLTCYGPDGEEAKSTVKGKTELPDVEVEYGATLDLSAYNFVPVRQMDYRRKGWVYVLSDGTKKAVDSNTVFTEEFFNECSGNEIVLVAQLSSNWTPLIPIN